jgi:deazaflavin-dependent oxidoreductase (nitroreductase family)
MHLPYFLRRVNRVVTNPLLGTIAWLVPPLAIVHHVGRKSGKPYRSPVVAFRTPTGFVIPMTYGRDVDWARNLLAAGGGVIERLGRRVHVRRPRVVDGGAAAPLLPVIPRGPLLAAHLPGYVVLDAA